MKHLILKSWEYVRSHPKKFLFLALFSIFLFWFFFDDYGIVKRVSMEVEHRRLLVEKELLSRRIRENEKRIGNAHDPDSIEKAARERYNFRRKGEVLFIIKE